eukprot:719562_1
MVWLGSTLFLVIYQLILGKGMQFNDDLEWFGIWTIIHFLAGPFFAVCLPFFWMFFVITVWEFLEALTVGFGESESLANRTVDIVVAVIGWWIIILIFKHTRKDIPWISSMNAAGNDGKEIDWSKVANKATCGHCFKKSDDHESKMAEQMGNNENNENKDKY